MYLMTILQIRTNIFRYTKSLPSVGLVVGVKSCTIKYTTE